MPASYGLMRPSGVTAVASLSTRPAPPRARPPRWARCQSPTRPSTEEYWHMGATQARLRIVVPRRVRGLSSRLMQGRPRGRAGCSCRPVCRGADGGHRDPLELDALEVAGGRDVDLRQPLEAGLREEVPAGVAEQHPRAAGRGGAQPRAARGRSSRGRSRRRRRAARPPRGGGRSSRSSTVKDDVEPVERRVERRPPAPRTGRRRPPGPTRPPARRAASATRPEPVARSSTRRPATSCGASRTYRARPCPPTQANAQNGGGSSPSPSSRSRSSHVCVTSSARCSRSSGTAGGSSHAGAAQDQPAAPAASTG